MRNRLGRLKAPMAVLATVALVGLGTAPAYAGTGNPDPVGDLLRTVTSQPSSGDSGPSPLPDLPALPGLPGAPSSGDGSSTSGAQGSSDVPPPSSDSDSPGHETPDPKEPDHGSATLTRAAVAGTPVAEVGRNTATTRKDDSTKADSTLLALGGQEVLGAHADSRKNGESHFGDPLKPLCDNSGGAVCLRVLYADAVARDNGSTSQSTSRSGIASACVGGDSTDPGAVCDGPVAVGAGRSSAESQRDQRTGRTTASSSSDLADVCLQQPGTAGCALGADAAHSEGQADSGGAKPSASRSSSLLGVTAGGKSQGSYETPTEIAIQPGCASPSLVCAYLNQGETYLGKHLAGTAQDALVAGVLPGSPLEIDAGVSHAETLVHNDGGEAAVRTGSASGPASAGPVGSGAAGGPGHPGLSTLGGVLPNTGGVWSGILAAGLGAVGLGALLMASARRRAGALV